MYAPSSTARLPGRCRQHPEGRRPVHQPDRRRRAAAVRGPAGRGMDLSRARQGHDAGRRAPAPAGVARSGLVKGRPPTHAGRGLPVREGMGRPAASEGHGELVQGPPGTVQVILFDLTEAPAELRATPQYSYRTGAGLPKAALDTGTVATT